MAELTNLESKLGEVVGLAMAAQDAAQKVAKLAKDGGDDELVGKLERMRDEAQRDGGARHRGRRERSRARRPRSSTRRAR